MEVKLVNEKEYNFDYLIEKINIADFSKSPFKHIYIEDFFDEIHFQEITKSKEIAPPLATNDNELIDGLYSQGFKIITFPGCVNDRKKYIKWHSENKKMQHHSACEGFGMVLRLYEIESPILKALNKFLASDQFNQAIAQKFGVNFSDCDVDGGIQKYLDGYEISPHPDIRKKAATFMVNINPSPESETLNIHTHYLKFKPSKSYVQTFWEGNPDVDRAWVPWSWADTENRQTKNNSIVLFSPSNDTLHAIKTEYNHLQTQRTQLYGNLWFRDTGVTKSTLEWEDLDLISKRLPAKNTSLGSNLRAKILQFIPTSTKKAIKGFMHRKDDLGNRSSSVK